MAGQPYIQAQAITMLFPGTLALDKVDFNVNPGEVVAIAGENGAGKSTLMKIFTGVHQKSSGTLIVDGEQMEFSSTSDSIKKGITMIYQELTNVPKISVAENIFLGRLPLKNKLGAVDFAKLYRDTEEIFKKYGIEIDARAKVDSLTVAEKQFVEIIKAITLQNAKVVIMDEPTSSLTKDEINRLFQIIRNLKRDNMGIVYISHRLDEVMELADRVVVFRDGKVIGEMAKGSYDEGKIVSMMIGRQVTEENREPALREEVIYEVKNLNIENRVNNFSMQIFKGEILGIAGLMGSGKDELVKCLFGLWPAKSKEIFFAGEQINSNSPEAVLKKGIVYLPEERKQQSLFLNMSVRKNISAIWVFNKRRLTPEASFTSEKALAAEYIRALSVKTPDDSQQIVNLSGGNQQKAVIGRLLAVKPKMMILNDPTRGIDVGSKEEIYRIIRRLSAEGTTVILASSELEEICKLSNRVIILSKGEIQGEFRDNEVTMENILPCVVRMKK